MAHFPARGELDSLQLGMVGDDADDRPPRPRGRRRPALVRASGRCGSRSSSRTARCACTSTTASRCPWRSTSRSRPARRAYGLRRGTMRAGHELIWDQSHMFQSGTYRGHVHPRGRGRTRSTTGGASATTRGGSATTPAARSGCGWRSSCPTGCSAVWHWELANGARIYTDGCFAPADGGRPDPDRRRPARAASGSTSTGGGRQLRAATATRSPASPATSTSCWRAAGRSGSTPTGRWAQRYGAARRRAQPGRGDHRRRPPGTGIYELTGAHHHRYFPIPRADDVPR